MTYLSEADFKEIKSILHLKLPTHFKNLRLQHKALTKELIERLHEMNQSIIDSKRESLEGLSREECVEEYLSKEIS